MFGAAVLRAEQMVRPRYSRLEPCEHIPIGQNVLLHAKRRNKKAMDHVLGDQRDFHWTPNRHVQFIDLTLAAGMLELPHPLFADAIDFQRVCRRAFHVIVNLRAPGKNHHRDAQRNDRPHDLQQGRPVDLLRFALRRPSVLDGKEKNKSGDDHGEKSREQHQEKVERVYLSGHVRGLLRKYWEIQVHLFGCPSKRPCRAASESRRNIINMKPPSTSTVANALKRKMLKMAAPYLAFVGS